MMMGFFPRDLGFFVLACISSICMTIELIVERLGFSKFLIFDQKTFNPTYSTYHFTSFFKKEVKSNESTGWFISTEKNESFFVFFK